MSAFRRLAFIIGINRYGNNIPALGSAVKDAQAIAEVLRNMHGYEVESYLDEDATLEKLRGLFNGLPEKVNENDRTVIYFAGHGIAESGDVEAEGPRGYFVPQDASRDNIKSFLPMVEVQGALDQLKCKQLLVLLDCCFAGAFKWSKTRAVAGRPKKKLTKERYDRYLRDPVRQVMTSASSNETALDVVSGKVLGVRDAEEGHSPFALALLEALKGSVADVGYDGQKGDGVTTATELHLYIESVMDTAEKKMGRAVQKPLLWAIDDRGRAGEFIFETPGQQIDLPSALVLSEENNPYRGLESYEEKHASMFFGRDKLIEQLAEVVDKQSLTLVLGASGSGKSSLVKAGLVRRLSHAQKRWAVVPPVRPGNAPMQALESAALAIAAWPVREVKPPAAGASALTLAEATRQLKTREPNLSVLLIIDQLEEVVTMASGAGADVRTRFFDALEDAREAGLCVVCTLRSDYEPHFLEIARTNPEARFPVRSMNREELRAVIEGPANEHTLEFTPPSLVDELIDEVHESPGALPLLSFTLSELYRERIKRDATDRALTKADYDKLGGVTGALGTRADHIFDNQPDAAAKQTMARVLLRLVSLKGGEATKRRVAKHELVSSNAAETARAEEIINELSRARLVIVGREDDGKQAAGGDSYVEAAHDKLVTGWKRLWEILAEHRDDLPLLRSCTVAAEEWDQDKRPANRLWNADPRLPQLEALQKKDPLRLNALETEFVKQSGARRRNLRFVLSVTVVVVIAGLSVAAIFARLSQLVAEQANMEAKLETMRAKKAERAAAQAQERALFSRLVAEASRPDSVTQEQALLLAVEAQGRIQRLPERKSINLATLTTDTTMRAVQQRPAATAKILRYGTGVPVSGLAWAPAPLGRPVVAAGGAGNSVVLWNADTGAELSRLALTQSVDPVSWSPRGEQLLIHTGWEHKWTVASTKGDALKVLASDFFLGTKIQNVDWSVDGKWALIVDTMSVVVWNADREAVTGTLDPQVEIAEGRILPGGKEALFCGRTTDSDKHGYAAIHAVASSNVVRVLVNEGARIEHCAVSPNGKWYATSTIDGVDLWSSAKGPPRHLGGGQANALAFNHKSTHLAAGTTTGVAALWNVDKKNENDRSRLQGHTAGLVSVQWNDDDSLLVTASADGTAIVWGTRYSTKLAVLSGHNKPLTNAVWDPASDATSDNTRVATSSEDGTVRIFKIGQPEPPSFDNVVDIAYAPSGKHVAIADKDGVVTVRVAAAGEAEVFHFGGGSTQDKIVTVRYCPNGATLVTRDAGLRAKVWDAGSGALVRVLDGKTDSDSTPTCSHDGRFIAAFDQNQVVHWEVATGVRTNTFVSNYDIRDPVWHPRKLVVAERIWATSKQVKLLGPDVGKNPVSFEGNVDGVYDVAWSHDGTRLVSGDNGASNAKNGRIHLYDKVLEGLEKTGSDDKKPTLDIQQLGNEKTFSLSWSPDDAYLVTGGSDAGRVWNTKTWTLQSTLAVDELTLVAWTPSVRNDRIATVDRHGMLRLFEPSTGVLVAAPTFKGQTVKNATWSPDGKRLLVLLSDATASLLTVYLEDLRTQLCERAIRNFTRDEWLTYIGNDESDPYRATCANLPIEPEPVGGATAP